MRLPIYKDRIPYRFESIFNETLYIFELHYNSEFDFFTVDLSIEDDVIVYGEKLVYGQQLFKSLNDDTLPKLTPIDPSGKHDRISYDNFGDTVILQLDNEEQADDEDAI